MSQYRSTATARTQGKALPERGIRHNSTHSYALLKFQPVASSAASKLFDFGIGSGCQKTRSAAFNTIQHILGFFKFQPVACSATSKLSDFWDWLWLSEKPESAAFNTIQHILAFFKFQPVACS